MDVTAEMIEEYLSDSNDAKLISEEEALACGGKVVERYIHADENVYDPIVYMTDIALEVSQIFMGIFSDDKYRIRSFTGYKVEEIPSSMGRTYKISTIVVSMSEFEWFHGNI